MRRPKPRLTLIVIGHVDSGKSTLTGHLLHLLGQIPTSTLSALETASTEIGKGSFKYAWIMDGLKAERERGMTIECSKRWFETRKYNVAIIDAPGHRDFIKNMITGTSQADAAILTIPSTSEFETSISPTSQTLDHLILAYTLGIKQLIIAVTKLDLSKYSQPRFKHILHTLAPILKKIGYRFANVAFVPVSGWTGENLASVSENLRWFQGWRMEGTGGVKVGMTLLEALDAVEVPNRDPEKPLRIPVMDVYRIGGIGTVAVGRVEYGTISAGELSLTSILPNMNSLPN
ncbi:translation elongation factor EF-1 alpha [Phlyctochytrium planicorne]|nr:translation elongation factor EF-1 alpha [Phlyctochytrium planicorne]